MASRKQSTSTLPKLAKDKTPASRKNSKGRMMLVSEDASSSSINSLPSLPSSPLVGDTNSLLSRTSSKRTRLKSQHSHTTPNPLMTEAVLSDERRTSSDPGARRRSTRHTSVVSTSGAENNSNSSELGHSISIGGKMVPTATSSKTPSPSTPAPTFGERGRAPRPRSNSVFVRPGPGSSEESLRRSRNSGSSSDLAARKGGIYEHQSHGDDTKRRSVPSGAAASGVSRSSPRWAGQLTDAVLELSQEINRLRDQGAIAVGPPGQPQSQSSSTKPKSTSLFWSQSALRNASVRT